VSIENSEIVPETHSESVLYCTVGAGIAHIVVTTLRAGRPGFDSLQGQES